MLSRRRLIEDLRRLLKQAGEPEGAGCTWTLCVRRNARGNALAVRPSIEADGEYSLVPASVVGYPLAEMALLKVVPKHWFGRHFRLEDPGGGLCAEVAVPSSLPIWDGGVVGSVTMGDRKYSVRLVRRPDMFLLEASGQQFATAVSIDGEFGLACEAGDYTLKRVTFWRGEFGIFQDDARVGSIVPGFGWTWTQRAKALLPEAMPGSVRAFCVWLTMLVWRCENAGS